MDAPKLVSSAIIGYDVKTIVVNDRHYVIHPPTIHRLSGAAYWLCEIPDIKDFKDILKSMESVNNASKALSFLIAGDESLAEELALATPEEIVNGLENGFSLVKTENFIKLSILRKSAGMMIAKPNT